MSLSVNRFPRWQTIGQAEQLAQHWQQQLLPMWNSMQHGSILSHDGFKLHYSYLCQPNARHAVVISPGRVEMAVKYTELCYELVQAGYSVFILDHRGQGNSDRLLKQPEKGYVAHFDDYCQDFSSFINQVVHPTGHKYHLLVGHSMGCAIAGRYLQQYQHPFNAAIFSAAMLGIYTGLLPAPLAEQLTTLLARLNYAITSTPWYFPGQSNYRQKAFKNNPLTSSQPRFSWLMQLYQHYPKTRLGGVTLAWLVAALAAMKQLQQDAGRWQTPVLLLQASADKVVSNYAQQQWYQHLPATIFHQQCKLAHAKHEVFMETDKIRAEAFSAVNTFLQHLPSPE